MPRKPDKIKRKSPIPESDRTPARDAAAEVIEEMWPADFTEIAEETDYSRQHIANTFEKYFEPAEAAPDRDLAALGQQNIEIPDGVDVGSYLQGVAEGYRLAKRTE